MRIILFFAIMCIMASCTSPKHKQAQDAPRVLYAYGSRDSINFCSGDAYKAALVLSFWKAYESGGFLSYEKYMADSIKFVLKDSVWQGRKNEVLKRYQHSRDEFIAVQCYIDFFKAVHNDDKNEDIVLVWGKIDGTIRPHTKLDSWSVQQVWKFNREGKIYFMQQFESRFNWP